MDYLDIIPPKPLLGEEKKVMEALREFAMKHRIAIVSPKAGGYNVGELVWLASGGEREGRSNTLRFQMLKARENGKTVMYLDWEAPFDPKQFAEPDK